MATAPSFLGVEVRHGGFNRFICSSRGTRELRQNSDRSLGEVPVATLEPEAMCRVLKTFACAS